VGIVVVDAAIGRVPQGLADSKLISAPRRESLVPKIQRWTQWHAVAHSTAAEIDRWGLTVALRLAGQRALSALEVQPDVVLLDGSYDWLSKRDEQTELWQIDVTTSDQAPALVVDASSPSWPECVVPDVVTQIKADLACASVAAASVLAKVTRDAIMTGLATQFPRFAWEENKGYASEWHREQLRQWGPCEHHRRSWRLGVDPSSVDPSSVAVNRVDVNSVDVNSGDVNSGDVNSVAVNSVAVNLVETEDQFAGSSTTDLTPEVLPSR
jgi:ribonuclease HII